MSGPDYSLKYIQAGLDELKNYLLAKDLFWPLGLSAPHGYSPYPKLTIGNLLLFLAQAQAYPNLDAAQQSVLQRAETQLDSTRRKWQVAWGEKADWEYKSRLRQWGHYLDELSRTKESHLPYYATEVRLRAMLDLLARTLPEPPTESSVLNILDKRLKALVAPGDFVWETALAAGFPPEQYWYLYRQLENI